MPGFLFRVSEQVGKVLSAHDRYAGVPAGLHQFMAFPADAGMDVKDCGTARFEPSGESLVKRYGLEPCLIAANEETSPVAIRAEGEHHLMGGCERTRERQHVFAHAGRHGTICGKHDQERTVRHSAASVQFTAVAASAFSRRRNVARACPTT